MVAFEPISIAVEVLSQIGIFFADKDAQKSIEDSKKIQKLYEAEAEASKEDTELYLLLVAKANKQKQQTTLLASQAIQENKKVVYTIGFVFLLALILLFFVFKIAFGWVKRRL
ncbi:hypothetical protein VB776_06805 [Arcicella sp. DC2W]|uniref:Uncharacterized protein n=1 Tax=Arcicella gelida TaxID=2984195 RepID=A0ABU5S2D8_9BACT|nr:hypothetical protein [Arcicella sp. DC2W]MEA5402616.1 hypothetical protein [Arcicella sp. DC2W]